MSVLNAEVREQVRQALADLPRPVLLELFVRAQGCEMCKETQTLLEEVSEASPYVIVEVRDLSAQAELAARRGIDTAPALVVLGEGPQGTWEDAGVLFFGIPSGYEFTSLIHAIQGVARGEGELLPQTRQVLAALDQDVDIRVFVTPTCPYCPRAVVLAHQLALASPRVRSAMVEAMEFPDWSMQHGVSGVPHTVINQQVHVIGALPEPQFVEELQRALVPA